MKKFGYVKLTHPQKNMSIFVDVLEIVAVHPYIFHETSSFAAETGEEVFDQAQAEELLAEGKLETKHNFSFIMTTVTLKNKTEINVKESPNVVAKRMAEVMENGND